MPSSVVTTAPETAAGPVGGGGDVRRIVPELHELVERMLPLLRDAAQLCAQVRGDRLID